MGAVKTLLFLGWAGFRNVDDIIVAVVDFIGFLFISFLLPLNSVTPEIKDQNMSNWK